MSEHVTDVQIHATAWQIGSTRHVAICACGWRGIPHLLNKPGRRAAFREASAHKKEATR